MATNGRTIIKDAIAHCSQLTDKFVDVDNEIASSHDFEFDEVLPFEVINKVCAEAQTSAGEIGFDSYVDPAGNTHVFKRGKYNSPISLQIEEYARSRDVHRIRNKIKVYGKRGEKPEDWKYGELWEKFYDSERDLYTEPQNDPPENWNATSGSLQKEITDVQVGSSCVRLHSATLSILEAHTDDFPEMLYGTPNKGYRGFHIKFKAGLGAVVFKVRLLAPDTSNYFETLLTNSEISAINGSWSGIDRDIGPAFIKTGEEEEGEGLKKWTKTGSPQWSEITRIQIHAEFNTATYILIEGLYFDGSRFYATYSDAASIAAYGTRHAKPQIDELLASDEECELKAKSLIEYLKEEVETFRTLRVEGNHFSPGDLVHVIIPNDGVDTWHRIVEVQDIVEDMNWDSILKVSNKPIMIDYVMLHKAQLIVQAMEEARSGAGAG